METETLTLQQIEDIAFDALVAVGTSEENARPLAVATAATGQTEWQVTVWRTFRFIANTSSVAK